MIKFRERWNEIKEYEVVKETEKQLTYIDEYNRQQREAKVSDWQSWHDTKEEARSFLIVKKMKEIEKLKAQIKYKEEEIERIQKL
jgi:hypothetical protein